MFRDRWPTFRSTAKWQMPWRFTRRFAEYPIFDRISSPAQDSMDSILRDAMGSAGHRLYFEEEAIARAAHMLLKGEAADGKPVTSKRFTKPFLVELGSTRRWCIYFSWVGDVGKAWNFLLEEIFGDYELLAEIRAGA